jgi:toxin YoeB
MRNIVFEPQAFQDFNNWVKEDKKVYAKIVGLIDDILRHPEPLKYELKGYWSRRITDEHPLVYSKGDR